MRALLYNGAFLQDNNVVCILNGTQPMSNYNHSLSHKELVKILNNLFLVIGIQ